jgi:hypothetical protein
VLYDDGRLLFFDLHNISSMENVTLTLNPPVKCGACLSKEKDWELGARALSVVFWEGAYRFYYITGIGDGRRALAFVTSTDGVNWERPNLGVVSYKGSKSNNLVDIQDSHPGETCVFIDPIGPDEHRFKCIGHMPYEGMFMLTSPDGLRFKRAKGLLLKYGTDNHMAAFYDPIISKYRIYCRGGDNSRSIMGWKGSRMVVLGETDDLFKPIPIDKNAPDPHDYGMERPGPDGKMIRPLPGINRELPTAIRMDDLDPPEADMYQAATVHYTANAYLAFPTLYYHYPGLDQGGFHNDGILDLQFAASRDGMLWRRDFRGSYVRLDLPEGPATKGMHMLLGMVPNGDILSQYYVGGRRTHGEGRTLENIKGTGFHDPHVGDPIVQRLEQRMDGFVSADSAYTGGSLVTEPFVLKNKKLKINIDTSASGVAHAALLDESGAEIPGFKLEEGDRIQGNDVSYTLSWGGKSSVSKLVGKKVKLLLKSRSAKLFAVYP